MREISPVALRRWLESSDSPPLLLDVREPDEHALGLLPDSIALPLGTLPEALADEALPLDRPLVCICHHGIRSRRAAWLLERAGAAEVHNLSGGLDAWAREADPDFPTYT